jgi:hypothetical protein
LSEGYILSELKKHIDHWITSKKLVRLQVVQKRTGRTFLYGRILQHDEAGQFILFYHDDEKKVSNISLNEVEDIHSSEQYKL